MSDQTAEHAFVKAFVNILGSQPVTFDNDFQEQPANTLKRVPVLSVCLTSKQSQLYNLSTVYSVA
jgi:ubiquitin-like protein 4